MGTANRAPVARYVPEAGGMVWLQFDSQAGHAQAGHRPALGVSPSVYNAKTGRLLCSPMTTQIKGYPFEGMIAGERPGAALADQFKNLDWGTRKTRHTGKVSADELAGPKAKIIALVGK